MSQRWPGVLFLVSAHNRFHGWSVRRVYRHVAHALEATTVCACACGGIPTSAYVRQTSDEIMLYMCVLLELILCNEIMYRCDEIIYMCVLLVLLLVPLDFLGGGRREIGTGLMGN